jgi:sulfide dehydrogenase cytochrome subunit
MTGEHRKDAIDPIGDHIMLQKATGLTLLACSALFGFSLASGAYAADVAKLVETCASCHGKDGASTESDVPIIGGYSSEYLSGSLTAYKQKERSCPETKIRAGEKKGTKTDMCKVAKDLSDGDVKEVAKYFAGKKFVRPTQKFDPALAQKGKKIHENDCEKCHSEGGSVASDDAGILAGQWMPYLNDQFKDFASGKRTAPKKMQPMLKKLDKAGIEALVNYYGSFK